MTDQEKAKWDKKYQRAKRKWAKEHPNGFSGQELFEFNQAFIKKHKLSPVQ
jgi:hypothetical protein